MQSVSVFSVASSLDRLGLTDRVRSIETDSGRVTVVLDFEPEPIDGPTPDVSVIPEERIVMRERLRDAFPGASIPEGD